MLFSFSFTFYFILKHDWTGVLIKIEVYICLNPFPDFTQ